MFSRSCLVSLMGMLEYMLVMSREANKYYTMIFSCVRLLLPLHHINCCYLVTHVSVGT